MGISLLAKRIRRFWSSLSLQLQSACIVAAIVFVSLAVPGIIRETRSSNLKEAELYFLPSITPYVIGQSFPVELRVKTDGTPINAMGFTLVYNPLYLEVMSMTTEKSFCTHYLDNYFDNQKGTIKVYCGSQQPGFLGDSLAVRLTMRARIPGTPAVVADPDTIELLANDGKGSNIIKDSPKLTLTIQQL